MRKLFNLYLEKNKLIHKKSVINKRIYVLVYLFIYLLIYLFIYLLVNNIDYEDMIDNDDYDDYEGVIDNDDNESIAVDVNEGYNRSNISIYLFYL
jgi:hypothetical protein